jgi:hypothetical protein
MRPSRAALLLSLLIGSEAFAQDPIAVPPPPPPPAPYLPFPTLPAVPLDEAVDGYGIAQDRTRARGAQGRLLWIDATANIDKVNTADKCAALVAKIKAVGFNTIVFDVKPIIGQTLYPSAFAPKLIEWVRPWKTQTLPAGFDPLRALATQARGQGIGLLVSVNAFSEGHREFPGQGPGDRHPEWQTVLYEPELRVRADGRDEWSALVTDRANLPARRSVDLALFTDLARVPKLAPGAQVALLGADGQVTALIDGSALPALAPKLPVGGAALIGAPGPAADYLRAHGLPGTRLELTQRPAFVTAAERRDRQVPLMTNPHQPEVRQRLLAMLNELVSGYPIDGVIFDDRLRYASLNADFSPQAREQFERWLGKPVSWPDDIFRWEVAWPTLERGITAGPYFDAWRVFRALTLRNFVADAVRTVRMANPSALVATYVGSWYPDYPDLGANWAADDLSAGFRFLNDSYKQTGWAPLVDFVVTGCYYGTASIAEAQGRGGAPGETVEAAGQFSNRAVNDASFVYAGLSLDRFKNRPDDLKRCLQAAAAATQGVMCFDLSHDIDALWPVFAEAFSRPAAAPHAVPGLLAEVRAARAARKSSGAVDPPVVLYRGASGTGF